MMLTSGLASKNRSSMQNSITLAYQSSHRKTSNFHTN